MAADADAEAVVRACRWTRPDTSPGIAPYVAFQGIWFVFCLVDMLSGFKGITLFVFTVSLIASICHTSGIVRMPIYQKCQLWHEISIPFA